MKILNDLFKDFEFIKVAQKEFPHGCQKSAEKKVETPKVKIRTVYPDGLTSWDKKQGWS